jgi:hypothetical protein
MATYGSEQGRIQHILQQAQMCSIQENLAKARAYQGANTCASCIPKAPNSGAISEYAYLLSQPNCYNYVKPPVPSESVRIARLIQATYEKENNPLDPNTRFIQYAPTVFPPACPPVGAEYLNASQPKPPSVCPILPNTPLNPILPA